MAPLPRSFFARDADIVARDLLGRVLVHEHPTRGRLAARLVETEAYFGPPGTNAHLLSRGTPLARRIVLKGDPAAHSFVGPTKRNRVMFGEPGHWYVYLIYGMHECANVVTGPLSPHEPQAVLLRAGEPLDGLDADADLGGPARLVKALGITRAADNEADATRAPLYVERGKRVPDGRVDITPRIGISKAAELPLRFLVGTANGEKRKANREARQGKGRRGRGQGAGLAHQLPRFLDGGGTFADHVDVAAGRERSSTGA